MVTSSISVDPKRSALMARVRQRGTRAEQAVGVALREMGLHYRLNVRTLVGSPDFANRRRRWAVFVHGCFWHQHPGCPRATIPKQRRSFWLNKFAANRRRDKRVLAQLRKLGFNVVIIWECQSEKPAVLRRCLSKILEARGV
jgi:DNA mismatch endonuclease (patch repair protein)